MVKVEIEVKSGDGMMREETEVCEAIGDTEEAW